MEDDLDNPLNESAKEFDKKLTLDEEKKSTPDGLKKLLEDVSKDVNFEKMGFNADELSKANEIFSSMMTDFDKTDQSNPFLQNYQQDRQQDQQKQAVPDNIGDILQDKEF